MDRPDDRHFRPNHPTHDAAGLFANTFDTGHEIREIAKLAEKLTGLFECGP
jgi:hypothetical protein